ncbi:MAG TPA: hypothetical protein VKX28_32070 [Xanthobacteraceae bacterium]|nr:hypothetical protein [Xanthobacteraceae bacterium]
MPVPLSGNGNRRRWWRGWWFIVHRGAQGRWIPDKVAVAMVIDDAVEDVGSQRITGQWIGCVWLPVSDIKAKSKVMTLRFAQKGRDWLRMERTGLVEARGYYSDAPRRRLTMRRRRKLDKCAGDFP